MMPDRQRQRPWDRARSSVDNAVDRSLFAFGDGVIDAFKPTTWGHAFIPPERRVWHSRVLGMSGIGAILPLPPRARRGLEAAQLRMYGAAICYVGFTSTPAGRNAQIAVIPPPMGERLKSTLCCPSRLAYCHAESERKRSSLDVWSRPLMGHSYRGIRRMRYGTDSTRERHDDRAAVFPSSV